MPARVQNGVATPACSDGWSDLTSTGIDMATAGLGARMRAPNSEHFCAGYSNRCDRAAAAASPQAKPISRLNGAFNTCRSASGAQKKRPNSRPALGAIIRHSVPHISQPFHSNNLTKRSMDCLSATPPAIRRLPIGPRPDHLRQHAVQAVAHSVDRTPAA